MEGKKQAAKILLPVINKIYNQIEQTHWLQKLAEALNVSEEVLRQTLEKKKEENKEAQGATLSIQKPAKSRDQMLSEQILAIVLKYPINITHLIDNLTPDLIRDKQLQNLYRSFVKICWRLMSLL